MIIRMLYSEFIKMRKICFWIPIISAVILILFTCMEWYLYFRHGEEGIYAGLNVMYLFLSFTMLLTITLLCSIMAETEHQSQGLMLLFSMSVKRKMLYSVKAIWVTILMFGGCLVIILGTSGIWIAYTDKPLPFSFLVAQVLGCFAASLPVLAIQLFLSFIVVNQAGPIALGVIGAISSLFLGRMKGGVLYLLPWAYPSMSSPFINDYISFIILGLLLGALLIWIGARHFSKMEIK